MITFAFLLYLLCASAQRLEAKPVLLPTSQHEDCSRLASIQNGPRVFLTISSLASTSLDGKRTERQIELNWYFSTGSQTDVLPITVLPDDWVGLFRYDPSDGPTDPEVRVSAMKYPGYYKTSVQFGRPSLGDSEEPAELCLGYWIGYIRRNETVASDCLKMRPSWMWDNRVALGDVPLHRLMLPGSHNSGSYQKYRGLLSENVFTRYLYCHDEDVWSQLLYGIRYLDVRVGYYPDTSAKIWINHDWARMIPLRNLTNDLKRFLERTNEVVILDIHRFPFGFEDEPQRHEELIQFLQSELGKFMSSSSLGQNVTMNDLWRSNKPLIVAYADSDFSNVRHNLWPGIIQEWGNKRSIGTLKKFLRTTIEAYRGQNLIWAAMSHLTQNTLYVIFNPTQGVRVFTDAIHKNVTSWFRDLWWDQANIICTDYFLSNNLIAVSVESNLRRTCKLGRR